MLFILSGVFYGFCVGFGVMCIKFLKLKVFMLGVVGKGLFLFGVVIIEDGSVKLFFFGGGVEGGFISWLLVWG